VNKTVLLHFEIGVMDSSRTNTGLVIRSVVLVKSSCAVGLPFLFSLTASDTFVINKKFRCLVVLIYNFKLHSFQKLNFA
jgi:hypothetical protein